MLPPREVLARYRIQDLLDQAEHARLVARLRSLHRARRRAATEVNIRATPAENDNGLLDQVQAGETSSAAVRVSTIELFFDLVFVFAVTQLTSLLAGESTVAGLGRVVLIFGNLWWIYGGYAWLTNAVPPRASLLRLLMLLGMGGFLVVALAIPTAFAGGGVLFGLGYLLVTLVHTGMFLLSSHEHAVRAMRRLGPANAIAAALLLLAAFTDGALQWMLWVAAFGLHWVSPFFTAVLGFPIRAAHFVERHGLIVLIGLGESIVAIGIGMTGQGLGADRIVIAVLGLALVAALWWLYFDGEDERAERVLDAAADDRASWLALYGFGYGFLPVLGGIIVFAAGVKNAVGHYGEPPAVSTTWLLAAGVATYLVGLAWFRQLLGIGPVGARLLIAGVVLSTATVGLVVSPGAQLAVLAAIVAGGVLAESAWEHREGRKGSPAPADGLPGRGDVMGIRYKLLGRTGLRLSELCLGAMIFGDIRGGWGASRDEAARIAERFAEAGGNFIDTANYYPGGESERIVGKLVAAEHERWVLSTKYTLWLRGPVALTARRSRQ
jgi:low temperature requirement protein LtrA